MPAGDRQKSEEGAAAVADAAANNNPLSEVGRAAPTGRALRKVEGTEIIFDAVFLGADALALVQMKRVTLHSRTDKDADAVLLVDHSAGSSISSSAASPDGAALCLADGDGWVAMYDLAALRAEPLSPPRYEAQLGAGIAGVAFSDDGARLLTMCAFGPVEVRDARAEGLPPLRVLAFRGPLSHLGTCFLRCAGGVAVAVGGGIENTSNIAPGAESKQARVWRLSVDAEEVAATLELTAFASAAAVRGDGGQIAVGGVDGAVRLFGNDGWTQSGELTEPGDGTIVRSMAYAPDWRRLVVGRSSGAFVVYDVDSGAAVARFVEGAGNIGFVAAFAPAGDAAALGGNSSKVMTLRELAPPPPSHRWAMGGAGAGAGDALAGATSVGDVVALAADSRLEVRSRSGAWPTLALELGAAIGCLTVVNNPVAVRPGGGHVACVLGPAKVVTCRALPSGAEAFTLDRSHLGGSIIGLCWSPSGDLLLVWGAFGTAIFDAAGAKLKVLSDEVYDVVYDAAFSADGARLATVGEGKVLVRDVASWDEVAHALPLGGAGWSVCFDPVGECVAAWVDNGSPAGSVIVHHLDGAAAPQRFPDANAQGALAFSADGRFLFAAGAGENHKSFPGYDRMVALSRATGAEAEWSAALAAIALPPGTLSGRTLVVPGLSAEGAAGAESIQIAVGSEFVEVDVGLARRAMDDNAWGFAQLVQLAATAGPVVVEDLMGRAPQCLNIREAATGDTPLHYCADTGNTAIAAACLGSEAAVFVPIANAAGKTALHVALERREQPLAQLLAESLTPHLTDATAALLMDALRTAALTMPQAVLPLLQAIEATVLIEHATVRTLHHRTEVIGLAKAALAPLDPERKDPKPFESEGADGLGSAAGLDLAPWNGTFPSTDKNATHALVALKTLMLPSLAGDPADTGGAAAFHAIVANCDASVYESELLRHVVHFKFETNVLPTLRQAAILYTGAMLLASAATLASSRQLEGGWDDGLIYIHAGQGAMVTAELVSLLAEGRQLVRQDSMSYFSSPWNVMDVGASVALIVGAVGHFQRSADTVHLFGALGVALKWFSAVRGLPTDPVKCSFDGLLTPCAL
jgi:WD40 repeat protein